MDLQMLASATKGLDSFGEAMQYSGAASGYKAQAGLLDLEAKSVISSGNFQADRMREQGGRFIARQRAGYAKAGVRLEGSPIEALMTSERNLSLDILMTRLNAANQANRIGFEALNARIAAGQAKTRMIQSIGSGILNMGISYAMAQGQINMGGGGVSKYGNIYGTDTPQGVRDMGTYSRL